MSPFGPLFRYELTRLARRGLQPRLRAAFAGLLLVALFLAYLAAFPGANSLQLLTEIDQPLTLEAASRFGSRFLVSFLFIQTLVVILITPAVVAGAIGEEKETGSLDLLLATSLTSWEIVTGKLAARVAFMASLLLTGLPVVTLVIFFGGVDVGQLLAGYAIALLTILSLGTFTLYLSVVMNTQGRAMLRAYMFAMGFSLFGFIGMCFQYPAYLSPVATVWVLVNGWPAWRAATPVVMYEVVGGYATLHATVAAVFLFLSVRGLRRLNNLGAPELRVSHDRYDWDENLPPIIVHDNARPHRTRWVPRVSERDPLFWKERHFGSYFSGFEGGTAFRVVLLLAGFGGCLSCCGASRYVGILAFSLALVIVGVGASASVAGERQRGTLDAMLGIPCPRSELLWAKVRASLLSSWLVVLLALGFGLYGRLVGAAGLLAAVALPMVLAGWMVAAGGLGLWLSVRCATRGSAIAWFFGIGITACILIPLVGSVLDRGPGEPKSLTAAFVHGLSPLMGLWNTDPRGWDYQRTDTGVVPCIGSLLGAAGAAVGGLLLVWLAARRFERNE